MQNISAISLVWILKTKHKQTDKQDKKDKKANVLKIIALLLFKKHFETKAVIVPEKAEIKAIIDRIRAALLTPIKQKSSKNFFPITLCKT